MLVVKLLVVLVLYYTIILYSIVLYHIFIDSLSLLLLASSSFISVSLSLLAVCYQTLFRFQLGVLTFPEVNTFVKVSTIFNKAKHI